MELKSAGKNAVGGVFRSVRFATAWITRFVKLRYHKWRCCKAQKNLDARASRLGKEVYSLYKQGETELLKSLVVQQQLKIMEEAESQLFAVMDRIEAIEAAYREKKEAISGQEEAISGKDEE